MDNFIYTGEFKSSFENVDAEVCNICFRLKSEMHGINKSCMFFLEYVLRELLNNAVEHGNKMDCDKKVLIEFMLSQKEIQIDVYDEGDGFDIHKNFETEQPENLRHRGVFSLKQLGFVILVDTGHVSARLGFDKEMCQT